MTHANYSVFAAREFGVTSPLRRKDSAKFEQMRRTQIALIDLAAALEKLKNLSYKHLERRFRDSKQNWIGSTLNRTKLWEAVRPPSEVADGLPQQLLRLLRKSRRLSRTDGEIHCVLSAAEVMTALCKEKTDLR